MDTRKGLHENWGGIKMFMSTIYPALYSLAIHKEDYVLSMCSRPLEDSFRLPLSVQAYEEFLMLEEELNLLHLQAGQGDSWRFIWNSATYTSKRFYKLNFVPLHPALPLDRMFGYGRQSVL